ncbi:hypothetical protein V6N11_024552 [Hibiscus sabdariffa]|uniref:Bifunctional inhibitor/plant lipid transfer protein/seed storage helical domain-containing protein n=1 Tax=Hibiscus sabdariffa TaxID=183260 RepID=A0ABR2QMQ6_9ROSI
MCASIKFIATLVLLITTGITQTSAASANHEVIGLMAPYRTLLNEKASPPPPYFTRYSYLDVLGFMSPCQPFLSLGDSDPSAECCGGVKKLAQLTKIKRDEQELCEGIKFVMRHYGAYDTKQLSVVGQKCDSDNTDCFKYLPRCYLVISKNFDLFEFC